MANDDAAAGRLKRDEEQEEAPCNNWGEEHGGCVDSENATINQYESELARALA